MAAAESLNEASKAKYAGAYSCIGWRIVEEMVYMKVTRRIRSGGYKRIVDS